MLVAFIPLTIFTVERKSRQPGFNFLSTLSAFRDTLLAHQIPRSVNPAELESIPCPGGTKTSPSIHSLERLDELLGLDGRRVDDLINVLAVAVCIGGGDVNEGLEVVHLLGQAEELLRGDYIQLQGMSAREKGDTVLNRVSVCVCGRRKGVQVSVYVKLRKVCTLEINRVFREKGFYGCVGIFTPLLIFQFGHLHARTFVFADD